jgi:Tol biopolymer transport system component
LIMTVNEPDSIETDMIVPLHSRLRARRLLLACLAAAGLAACHDDPVQPPPVAEVAELSLNASVAGTPVQALVVTVSAADIPAALVFNLLVQDGVANGTLRVPPGVARRIAVEALDTAGVATHEGSLTVDVRAGSNPVLSIPLQARAGQLPITARVTDFSLSIAEGGRTLRVGESVRLSARLSAGGNHYPAEVQWASTDPSRVVVDAQGRVTALRTGQARIVAVHAGVVAAVAVAVTDDAVPDAIVFRRRHTEESGSHFIYRMNPDGSGVARVTQLPGYHLQPVLSPDRKRVAFASLDDADGIDLWVVNVDGTGLRRLTHTPGPNKRESNPRWSPDGRRIAYVVFDRVFVIFADGEPDPVEVPGIRTDAVSWSPDGRRLVFTAGDGEHTNAIQTVRLDGSERVTIALEGRTPLWSPDGSRIAFSLPRGATSGIFTVRPDGGDLRRLNADNDYAWVHGWSPDGSRLLVSRSRTAQPSQLFTMNPDGSGAVEIPRPEGFIADFSWWGS